mgnify:CR=1 FL=1
MSEQPGHLLDSLTGRQRLLDRFERIEKLLIEQAERAGQRFDHIAERIDHIEQRIDFVERRLEEAIAYFAWRSNRLVDSQSAYLGENTAKLAAGIDAYDPGAGWTPTGDAFANAEDEAGE